MFSIMSGHYARVIDASSDTIYCVTSRSNSMTKVLSKEQYELGEEVGIRKQIFLYNNLKPDEIFALNQNTTGLYIVYNSLVKGLGLKKALYYRKLLKEGKCR